MKPLKILYALVCAVLMTSCGTTGSFFRDLGNFADHGIREFQRVMPADSYDHTLFDAYNSGTGGKALAGAEIAVGIAGGLAKKDVSALKKRIHNAAASLSQNETYNKNNVNNWVGALFTLGDEFICEYNEQKFEEEVNRLTSDEETALRISYIDYENRKIVWKSNYEYMRDLMEYRASKNDSWLSENLEAMCNMSLDDYNNLSNEERQNVDMMLLVYDKQKNQTNIDKVEKTEKVKKPTTPDYKSLIEGIVVSDYDFNSSVLSDSQKAILNRIVQILNDNKSLNLQIVGHTCSIGSEQNNYTVGMNRAIEAKNYLIDSGINENRINVESLGSSHPVADNDSDEGRKANRRITFKLN